MSSDEPGSYQRREERKAGLQQNGRSLMGDDKAATSSTLGTRVLGDRELLMQSHVEDVEDPLKAGPPQHSGYHAGREVGYFRLLLFCMIYNFCC